MYRLRVKAQIHRYILNMVAFHVDASKLKFSFISSYRRMGWQTYVYVSVCRGWFGPLQVTCSNDSTRDLIPDERGPMKLNPTSFVFRT